MIGLMLAWSMPALTSTVIWQWIFDTQYGIVNWATRGLFVGERHIYASPQVDDGFIDDERWVPSMACGQTGGPRWAPGSHTSAESSDGTLAPSPTRSCSPMARTSTKRPNNFKPKSP